MSTDALAPRDVPQIQSLEQWRAFLATLTDVAEVRRAYTVAEAHQRYGANAETQSLAARAKIWAAYRGGELLADLERSKGGRPPETPATVAGVSPYTEAIADARMSERTARRWQDVWSFGDAAVERQIAEAWPEPTIRNLLRAFRDAQAEDKRRRRKADAADGDTPAPTADLRVGDFRDVLADLSDVDAIITDPPYEKAAVPLYGDLARFADRVLTPDGVLAVMCGQSWLPEVMAEMSSGRPYRWCLAYMTLGSATVIHGRRVASNWKPVLVYGAGPRIGDVIASDAADKRLHDWGQSLSGFAVLVERLTAPGALVCDPFLGAGTTGAVALELGRRFIGCDVDGAAVETAAVRLGG